MAQNDDLRQIIDGCKKGDDRCFSRLIDTYATRLYGYFYRLAANRDTADELLSELFVKLVEKIDSFKGDNFDAWLFKVASNIFYDHLRDRQKQHKLLEKARQQHLPESQDKLTDDKLFDELQNGLDKLDVDTKELIMLRFYSQLSFKQIAQMRSEPIGTTLSKLHRGLKKLKHLMGKS